MKKKLFVFILLTLVVSLLLGACGPTATKAPAAEESALVEEATPAEEEAPAEEAAPAEEESLVGGTFKYAVRTEPDTLDPHKTAMAVSDTIMQYIGGSLVWMTPDFTYEPYLAESWSTSEDGLVWTFILRQDVKFHDGTPLTAHDYAYTFNRAIDPAIASPGAGAMLGDVISIEAIDDYTLAITLPQPNAPILYALSDPGYMQPISQAILESVGEDNFGRAPVGVGPFIFKEWATGEKIVLQRNPDYNWGPASVQNSGAFYIETLEFEVIPEYATILAGLESGDLDAATVEPVDVDRLQETELFSIYSGLNPGITPYVTFNLSKPPFDDVLVRQAFNLAVDRDSLVQVVVQGKGEPQYGYLSATVMGSWKGAEEAGYHYDLEAAKALMEEAGYTLNADGIYEKDGVSLSLVLYSGIADQVIKTAQVLVEQYAQLGVKLEIQQMESGILYPKFMSGEYEIGMAGLTYGEADLMYIAMHSSMIGGLNLSYLNSPEFDALLEQSRAESDQVARQAVLDELQQIILEEAYVVPLYAPMAFTAVSKDWQGVVFNEPLITLDLSGAFLPK